MNRNLISIIIIVLAAMFFVWRFWPAPAGQDVKISPSSAQGRALELVARLKAIEIDTSFLDDSEFLGLENFPKPSFDGLTRGRPNPFLPIAAPSIPSTRSPSRR